jgi:methylmalonyl-CoA/ethylmalonyl-CoA epimerase
VNNIEQDFKDCVLDHIAIAVRSLSERKKTYEDLGFSFHEEVEVVKEQGVQVAFAQVDSHAKIELLEPLNDESPIAKHISKRGEGIHHLCFRVKDIKKKQTDLTEKGYQFIYDEPKTGAAGCLVNFIHPKSSGGVLIELNQKENQ